MAMLFVADEKEWKSDGNKVKDTRTRIAKEKNAIRGLFFVFLGCRERYIFIKIKRRTDV